MEYQFKNLFLQFKHVKDVCFLNRILKLFISKKKKLG